MRAERLRAPAALSARCDDAAVVLGREPVISDYQLIGLSRFLLTHATRGYGARRLLPDHLGQLAQVLCNHGEQQLVLRAPIGSGSIEGRPIVL
jgi:hypothetical protein